MVGTQGRDPRSATNVQLQNETLFRETLSVMREFSKMSEQLKVSAICSILAMAAFAIVGPVSAPADSSINGDFGMIGQSAEQDSTALPSLTMPQLPSLD